MTLWYDARIPPTILLFAHWSHAPCDPPWGKEPTRKMIHCFAHFKRTFHFVVALLQNLSERNSQIYLNKHSPLFPWLKNIVLSHIFSLTTDSNFNHNHHTPNRSPDSDLSRNQVWAPTVCVCVCSQGVSGLSHQPSTGADGGVEESRQHSGQRPCQRYTHTHTYTHTLADSRNNQPVKFMSSGSEFYPLCPHTQFYFQLSCSSELFLQFFSFFT